jgi:trk system potassium uptake protein TrkH
MNRILPIVHVLGLVVLIFAFALLLPVATAYYFQDAALLEYDEAFAITFLSGFFMWLLTRRHKRELQIKDGFLLVALVWAALPAFAALPFILFLDASFTDAYFEAASGMSTTGATVFAGLDSMPPSINLWRHLLNWMGGMGIIVLAVAILPMLGIGGRQMFKAETPGPMKDSQLTPRIAQTAKGLWAVYAVITLACIIGLRLAGMNWFDAVCHAFSALSLGGFSTHDSSVGYFNSVPIEVVLTLFQVIAAGNFTTHFLAWRTRNAAVYRSDAEMRSLVIWLAAGVLVVTIFLWQKGVYPDLLTALRHASFNVVTIATDCGYASTDFGQWPIFAPLLMLMMSSALACSGSTGGGIKMIRTMILFKQAGREMKRLMHPQAQIPLKIGLQVIENKVVFSVLAFVALYLATVITLSFLLMASGLDFISAFSGIIACINNAGPGLGVVGPATNYGVLSDFQTWICALAMVLGRLELFTLFILFTRTFWRS